MTKQFKTNVLNLEHFWKTHGCHSIVQLLRLRLLEFSKNTSHKIPRCSVYT